MASTSTRTVQVEPKPAETTATPRPAERPADKPFTIKLQTGIPT